MMPKPEGDVTYLNAGRCLAIAKEEGEDIVLTVVASLQPPRIATDSVHVHVE